jgi:hypothetical protein
VYLRTDSYQHHRQLSFDNIGTALSLTAPVAVAFATQHSHNPRLSSSGSSSGFLKIFLDLISISAQSDEFARLR